MKKLKEVETWLPVEGYRGLYSISSLGRVRNDKRGSYLKGSKNQSGYLQVALKKEGTNKLFLIHRLVANAFLPNLLDGVEVDHIDGNKCNNKVYNLRWCSSHENKMYVSRTKRSEKSKKSIVRRVQQIDLEGNVIKVFPNAAQAARELGFCAECISGCCRGKYKTAYNFLWKYENPEENG